VARNQATAAYLRALQLAAVFVIFAMIYLVVIMQWSAHARTASQSVQQWMPEALGGGKHASRKLH
jgi:hypothetical protein